MLLTPQQILEPPAVSPSVSDQPDDDTDVQAQIAARAMDNVAERAHQVNALISAVTASPHVDIVAHAYRIPAATWHALPQAVVVMPSTSRPTHVAKTLVAEFGVHLTAWCAHGDACPELVRARSAWDAALDEPIPYLLSQSAYEILRALDD